MYLKTMSRKEVLSILVFILVTFIETRGNDVRLPPSIVVSPIKSKTFRTDSGDALDLECQASGVPNVEYYWKKNGKTLEGFGGRIIHTTHGSIRIPQLGPIDEGYYQCFASNQYGVALSNMVVLERALLGSYTGKSVMDYPVTEWEPFTLPCHPTKWFPKPVFSWAVVGSVDDDTETPITPTKRIQIDDDGNLHFSYAMLADAQDGKLYKCKLFNPYLDVTIGGSYAKVNVKAAGTQNIFTPRHSFSSKSPVIGLEGKELILKCFFAAVPDPMISWGKVGGSLPIGRYRIINFNTELIIRDLQQKDAGMFTCTGQNTQGESEQTINVKVEAEPRFISILDKPHDINVTEGDTVMINCTSYADPPAAVTWMKNGEVLNPSLLPPRFRLTDDGRSLIIRDVCKDCGGDATDLVVIQCNASNSHGYAFANGYMNVLKRTVITIPPESRTLLADEDRISFEFNATSDDSTPVTLSWYRIYEDQAEEKVYPIANRIQVDNYGRLSFYLPHNSSDRVSFRGIYQARADNGYSVDKADIVLESEDMPYIPPVAAGSSILADYWWIILIIALILLLLILLLCCCICLQRNKGDSYPVDEKERKNGNNPVKELADSGFHDYHRPDGELLRGSRASLNSSIKMDSDEEASLNEYGDIDAGKFTEDGSFIGDYTTERRRDRLSYA